MEIIVVDNSSDDQTAQRAREAGAIVVNEARRGYGFAYKAGFKAARGEIIATGDADSSYPFADLSRLLGIFKEENLDFLTTNRFYRGFKIPMRSINKIGNIVLSFITHLLYGKFVEDSQSGMWIFKRELLDKMILRSNGMPFSQEIKIEACYYLRSKYKEIPIDYAKRVGKVKLRRLRDGVENLITLFLKRFIR